MTPVQTPAFVGGEVQRPGGADADVAVALRLAIQRALAFGGTPVHRLGSARTSVTFVVDERSACAVTVLLDRHPPEVLDGDEPTEATIFLTSAQAARFRCGLLVLPNELLAGRVGSRGPVRRYLRVDPILRALLTRVHELGASTARTAEEPPPRGAFRRDQRAKERG